MDKLDREIKQTEARLKRLQHAQSMRDPEYRRMYEQFGDPEALGRTHARLIQRERGAQRGEG